MVPFQKKIGEWQVDLGDVDVVVGEYRPPGYRGNAIDLNGTRSGSIYQAVPVQPGLRYTVKFLAAGKWAGNDNRPRVVTVRLGKQKMTFSIAKPADWSPSAVDWKCIRPTFWLRERRRRCDLPRKHPVLQTVP
jgi:hypothetical protein